MSITPNLATVLTTLLEEYSQELHTAIPGTVSEIYTSENAVDVKPGLKRVRRDEDGNRISEDYPVLPHVPVCWPRGNDFAITAPIKKGDGVLVIVSESNDTMWRQTGTASDPGDIRRHSFTGCWAIPGAFRQTKPFSSASSSSMVVGKQAGPRIIISESNISLGADATEPIIKGNQYNTAISVFMTALSTFVDATAASAGAKTVMKAAITAFQTSLLLQLSNVSKTE